MFRGERKIHRFGRGGGDSPVWAGPGPGGFRIPLCIEFLLLALYSTSGTNCMVRASCSNFLQPLVTIRNGCFCEPLVVERDG